MLPGKELTEELRELIARYENEDPARLALLLSDTGLPRELIIQQVVGRQVAKNKLPSWYACEDILYPPKISLEQASSEKTALFKSSLVKGKTLIDLSAGYGVDDCFFARSFSRVIAVEPNSELIAIASQNHAKLGIKNIEYIHSDAAGYLNDSPEKADVVYIDPSRRNELKEKKYRLEDSSPDVIALKDTIFGITDRILIKTAPFLDITQTIESLGNVEKVYVVAVENECKEVLYELSKTANNIPDILAIHFRRDDIQEFTYAPGKEQEITVEYSQPLKFIYEPNAAILKAGAFKSTAESFNLKKLHRHSHLYTSNEEVMGFPGKSFQVKAFGPYRKDFAANYENGKAIITLRNFRESVSGIRKKLKLKEGGHLYLIATTGADNKPLLICGERLAD